MVKSASATKNIFVGLDSKTEACQDDYYVAKTLRSLDRKIIQAKFDFEENGSTRKRNFGIATFSDLAELWFQIMRHGLVQIIH